MTGVWVIRIDRGTRGGGIAWFTGHMETEDEREAQAFDTRQQAEAMESLCGLYRLMKWRTTVVPSVKVKLPGAVAVRTKTKSKKTTGKQQRQLDLF